MNTLQHIIKDNTKFAMHMAVELCEQGDFDSVSEAFRWLMQEHETTTPGSECELEIKDSTHEPDGTGAVWWECSSCHWKIEFFHAKWLVHANFCPECGARIRKAVTR